MISKIRMKEQIFNTQKQIHFTQQKQKQNTIIPKKKNQKKKKK